MLPLLSALLLIALVLFLGRWRVLLRKARDTRPVLAHWNSLTRGEKLRRVSAPDFVAGLTAASAQFPRTLRRLPAATAAADLAALDSLFQIYLRELGRSDVASTGDEWQQALVRVQRWLGSDQYAPLP